MRYSAYSEYCNDLTEWVGDIPSHWKRIGLGKLINFMRNGISATQTEEGDNTAKVTRIETISKGVINISKVGYISEGLIDGRFLLIKGDLQFSNINSLKMIGNCALVEEVETVYAGMNLLHIRPIPRLVSPKFMYYQFVSPIFRNRVSAFAKPAINQASIPSSTLKLFDFILPPLNEQTRIAAFLDKEIAKIDTLIEKQEQLIKLLQEKRQAVISHAVTKGLNPNAKTKDSGAGWLGEVPEHWKTLRIKNIFEIRKRIAGELGHNVLAITQKGIKVKDIKGGEGQLSMDYSKYQLVKIGDFGMNHMDLLTGWVDISKYDGVTSPDYRVFTLVASESVPEYYLYLLQAGYNEKIFYAFGQGSSHLGRWRFPTDNFKAFVFPCPPVDEQKQIAQFIKEEHDKIELLIAKCTNAIELMKERRAALISAAVTGKIDVRNVTT